ncbi:hypothetical protein MCEMRE212_00034 [Candidatus Nanopelagicaceae bacterium]
MSISRSIRVKLSDGSINLIIAAVPLLFWCTSLFPAVLTPDSYQVLSLIRDGRLSDVHTLSYELLVQFLGLKGQALYLVTIFQSVLSYYALFLVNRFLLGDSCSSRKVFLTTSIIYSTPFFGPIGMTLWKDSLSTSLVIISLIKILPFFSRPNKLNISYLAPWSLLFVVALTFRHEAPFGFLILCGLLFSCSFLKYFSSNSKMLKQFSVYIFLISTLSMGFSSINSRLVHSEPTDRYMTSISFLLDLEYVNSRYPEMLAPRSREILTLISSGPSLKGAASCDNPYNFWSEGLDVHQANIHALEIPGLWLQATQGNPRDSLLKARFCRIASFIPWPFSNAPHYGYWPTTGISPNDLGYENPVPLFPLYTLAFIWSYLWSVNGNLLGWPGLHFSVIIFSAYFLKNRLSVFREQRIFLEVFLLYFISLIMILSLVSPSSEFRYLNSVYYFSLPIFAMLISQFRSPKSDFTEVSQD